MNCTLIIVTLFILDRPFFGTSTKKKESWKKKKRQTERQLERKKQKTKRKKKKRKLERERGGERRKLIKEGNILNIKEGG